MFCVRKSLLINQRDIYLEIFRQRVDSLGENPYPSGIKKIEGEEELYRLRVGDYRILYQVKGKLLLVLIVRIGHRREVYRRIGG